VRYDGIEVFLTFYVMSLSSNVLPGATESQCSERSRGVACVSLETCNTTRDKEFCTLGRFAKFWLDVFDISELE